MQTFEGSLGRGQSGVRASSLVVGGSRWLVVAAFALVGCGTGQSKPVEEALGSARQAIVRAVPYRINALDYVAFNDSDALHEGNCGSGPVDSETTTEANGGCNVGWTHPGEWLEYSIQVATASRFTIVPRVSSTLTGRVFRVSLDGVDLAGALSVPSAGWQGFADRPIKDVALSAGSHTLRVSFETGDTNLSYVDVVPSSVALPARIEAENYQRSFDSTPTSNTGNGCNRGDGVDKETTADTAGGGCSIGWATAGEWLEYDVGVVQGGSYNFTLRAASNSTGRTLRLSLDGTDIGTASVPSAGWAAFQDRTLSAINVNAGPHVLRVTFPEGEANLNYVDVTSNAPPAIVVPHRLKALDYSSFVDSDNIHEGNCGSGPVDAEATSDPTSTGCSIGYTRAGERLDYTVRTPTTGKFQLSARVASALAGKTFLLSVDGQAVSTALSVPNAGWQAFADQSVRDVPFSAGVHTVSLLFQTGDTNLSYLDLSPGTVELPARIEAESYQRSFDSTPTTNLGNACDRGDGVDKETTQDIAGGGCNVGWTTPSEWLEYDVYAPQATPFDITLRVGSALDGRTVQLSLDGASIGAVSVPNIGWTHFEDRKLGHVPLSAGYHTLRVSFPQGETNFNYLNVSESASTSPPAVADNFGNAAGFNVYVFQDLKNLPSVAGPVAAGRDIAAQGFGFNTSSSGTIGAVAGRNFFGTGGSVHRDLVYGSSQSLSGVGVLDGTIRQGTPLNFSADRTYFEGLSAGLATLTTNGQVQSSPGGTFEFIGADPARNVFTIDSNLLATSDLLKFSTPPSSTVVINVTGSSAVFETTGMALNGLTPGHLIWNFRDATDVRLSLMAFKGTLLAPSAVVSQNGVDFEGALIAESLYGGDSGMTWAPFNGPWPYCTSTEYNPCPVGGASWSKPKPYTALPSDTDAILPSATGGASAPGRIAGTSSVDSSGAFHYRVPLQVPPGRAGMQPQLALSYNSGGSNGLVGVGWALDGLSAIGRCPKTIAREEFADSIKIRRADFCAPGQSCPGPQSQKYSPDIDNFCLDGEKLVRVGGDDLGPVFRTERDSQSKILANYNGSFWPTTFTVFRRDGNIATYAQPPSVSAPSGYDATTGSPSASRVSGVLTWPMTSLRDRFGNEIDYDYTSAAENGEPTAARLPTLIRYTTCSTGFACPYGQSATRIVHFSYEDRPDYLTRWSGGLNASVGSRLSGIQEFTVDQGNPHLVRTYSLGYEASAATGRSRLTSLKESDGAGVCAPPTQFKWGTGKGADFRRTWHVLGSDEQPDYVAPGQCDANLAPDCFWADFTPMPQMLGSIQGDGFAPNQTSMSIADFDGNGTDDILALQPDGQHRLFLSKVVNGQVTFPVSQNQGMFADLTTIALDIDQDGVSEIMVRDHFPSEWVIGHYDPDSGSFVNVALDGHTKLVFHTEYKNRPNPPFFMDVNGDGILDEFWDNNPPATNGDDSPKWMLSLAEPLSNSLIPHSYLDPQQQFWDPAPEDEDIFYDAVCHLLPMDYAGHGRKSPVGVCDDTAAQASGDRNFTGDYQTVFVDLNGDGLSDTLKFFNYAGQSSVTERMSVGFELLGGNGTPIPSHSQGLQQRAPVDLDPSQGFSSPDWDPWPNVVVDINGDGLADILRGGTARQYPGSNTSLEVWVGGNVPGRTTIRKTLLPQSRPRLAAPQIGDFNGDGLPDIVQTTQDGKLQFLIQDSSNRDDVLTGVVSDTVDLAKVTYKAGSREELGPVAPPDPTDMNRTGGLNLGPVFVPRRGLNVVSELDTLEGQARGLYYYQYSDAATDVSGRGFLGFGKIIRADVLRSALTTTTYDNKYYEGDLHGYHVFPFAFLPKTIETITGIDPVANMGIVPPVAPQATTLVKRTDQTTQSYRTRKLFANGGSMNASTAYFVENFATQTRKFDESGTVYYAGSITRTYDDFANVTDVVSNDGPEYTVVHSIVNNDAGTNWFIGKVQSTATTQTRTGFTGPVDTQTALPQTATFTYGAKGDLRSVTRTPGASPTQTVTRYQTDGAGLVRTVSTTDNFGNLRAESVEYSSDGAYQEHLQNTLGHDSWFGYHSGLGVPLISFDANLNETFYVYDGFGNPRVVTPTRAPATTITYTQLNGQLQVTSRQTPGTHQTSFFDQRGQLVRSQVFVNGDDAITDYFYDLLGRLRAQSVPHFVGDTIGYTVYSYDNLNEVRAVVRPDGSLVKQDPVNALMTQTVLSGDGSSENPDRITLVSKTPDGLVLSLRETSLTGPVTTRGLDFVYGQGKGLVQVQELGGPTTTYYSLGLPKPSRVVDSERGETRFDYDGFFNTRRITHVASSPQLGSSESFDFDGIGRITHVAAASPSLTNPNTFVTRDTRYTYDVGQGAIGRLIESDSADDVKVNYQYTPEGLLSEKKYLSGSESLRVNFYYDSYGRVQHIDYPETDQTRFGVNLGYNDLGGAADGQLRLVSNNGTTFWRAMARGPDGLAQQVELAGGLIQEIDVASSTRQITDIVAGSATQTFNVHYDYFKGGNVKSKTDRVTGIVDQFTYDGFDQLATWSVSGGGLPPLTEVYSYDVLGNQKSSGATTRVFGGAGFSPHQLASQTTGTDLRTFAYDYRGRQQSMQINGTTARTVSYTSFDLPSSVSTGVPERTVRYRYDANHHKYDETGGSVDTTYIDELYERRLDRSTNTTKHVFSVFAEGHRVAQVVQSGAALTTTVLHSDLLGSVVASTRIGSSSSTTHQAFSPWGDRIAASSNALRSSLDDVTVGFTGQEHDENVGLMNMRGRIYDPGTRTFLSPDPVASSLYRVGAWNKYSYVRNNPVGRTDPSGFEDITITGPDGTSRTEQVDMTIVGYYAELGMASPAPGLPSNSGPAFDAGSAAAGGGSPSSPSPTLEPEAYRVTFNSHGPGTHDPFGLQPDVVVTPDWSVPTPAPTPLAQLLQGGPSGGNKGGVVQRPKPVPMVGDVYTAFFDKHASDEAKQAARAEIAINILLIASGDPELVESREVLNAVGTSTRVMTTMGEDVAEAVIVREVGHGERLADIVAEVADRTRTTDLEHSVVSLADGRRVIAHGGQDGIDFVNMDIRRILGHSHPVGSLPGASLEDATAMQNYFQRSSWLLEVGPNSYTVTRIRAY